MAAMQAALFTDLFQLFLEKSNPPADLTAVHFQLRFARAAHADTTTAAAGATTGLARKVGPGPGQAGQAVFILGQFHLDTAFARAGMAGKNIQNEGSPVDHLDLLAQHLFDFALLAGREFIIENGHRCPGLQH